MRLLTRTVFFVAALLRIVLPAAGQDLPMATPQQVGFSAERLERIGPAVQEFIDTKQLAGAVTIVARRGKVVQFEAYGMMDLAAKKPMQKDTLFRIYSMTKAPASVAAMMLCEEGKLQLDAPVSKYLPAVKEMKVGGKKQAREITVRDLLRHTAGFPNNVTVDRTYRKAGLPPLSQSSLKEMMEKLGHVQLIYQPGTKWYYSCGTEVLARLIEVASGRPFDEFLARRIFRPLGMKDTGFYVPAEKRDRFAVMYGNGLKVVDAPQPGTSGPFTFEKPPKFLSAGGGLVSTAADYMRFCLMLSGMGALDGRRLLKAETVAEMTRNQLPEHLTVTRGTKGRGFGLGFAVRVHRIDSAPSSVGEYEWYGGGGTEFWISPRDELVVITLTQQLPMRQLGRTLKPIVYGAIVEEKVQKKADKPNIVLIMADDMGWSDAGCYGGEIQTPNLDRLAREGLRFTQFYNCARCVPTRASLIYGVYPQQAGVTANSGGRKVELCISLAEALKTAGYRTLMTGKWHGSQNPVARGFDRYYGLLSGCCNYFNPGKQRAGEAKPGHKRPGDYRPWGENGKVIRPFTPEDPDFYTTDAFTDRALEYLDKYGWKDSPFFLYLAYTAPHFPIQAPAEDVARYRGKYKMGWDAIRQQRYGRQKQMGLIDTKWPLSTRDPGAPQWENAKSQDEWDLKMAVYAAMIDRMDRNIGRILDKLRELNEEENTLVLFLSDNGACAERWHATPEVPPGPVDSYRTVDLPWANASDTPFRKFKQWTHEGGIATPLIVRWPGKINRGTITSQVGHVIDILPTFCEVAGIESPRQYKGQEIIPSEGKSLLPVFQGRQRDGHQWLFWEHVGNKAVRHGKWKLVGFGNPSDPNNWKLYDLEADRTELKNLAQEHPDRVKQMAQAWRNWAKRTGLP